MWIAIIIIIMIFIGVFYFLEGHEEVFYTQIDNSKLESIFATDNMKYEYTLECFNKKGKSKELKFKTSRELREGAYLKLEVRTLGVHTWEEVSFDELPDKVKINYNK